VVGRLCVGFRTRKGGYAISTGRKAMRMQRQRSRSSRGGEEVTAVRRQEVSTCGVKVSPRRSASPSRRRSGGRGWPGPGCTPSRGTIAGTSGAAAGGSFYTELHKIPQRRPFHRSRVLTEGGIFWGSAWYEIQNYFTPPCKHIKPYL